VAGENLTVLSASKAKPGLRLSEYLKVTEAVQSLPFIHYKKLKEKSRAGAQVFRGSELVGIH
jgi:hypothetical protein